MPKAVMSDLEAEAAEGGVTEQDLIGYLASKGVEARRAGGAEVAVRCWNCNDSDERKRKLYLNTDTWLYWCFVCGENGNRKTLLAHFGDTDGLTYEQGADPLRLRRMYQDAAELAHTYLLGQEDQCQYLLDRGLSEQMILGQKYGYVGKNVGLAATLRQNLGYTIKEMVAAGLLTSGGRETFNDSFVIPYWTHGTVIQLRARHQWWKKGDPVGKYQTLANDRPRIYNGDSLLAAREALVIEGEWDVDRVRVELAKSGDRRLSSMAVVGVPGAGVWPDELVDMLARVDKVFIGFDPDETGKRFADKLKEEVGNRARVVELPDDATEPDWTDFLGPRTPTNPHGGHDWRGIRDLLTEADLHGKRLFSVQDAATTWRRRNTATPGLKLGFPSMDAILRPGLKPGQVMIPLAGTGTGKTVWMSNVAWNVRSEGCLYVSLEMTKEEVFEHFRRIHRFWYPAGTEEELFEELRKIRIVDQNRIRKGDLEGYIGEYAEEIGHKPGLAMVDYLQYYARGFPGNSAYDRATDAVMEIKGVSKGERVPFIVPSQVSRKGEPGRPLMLNDARDAGPIEETGDFVVSMFRPEMAITRDDPAPSSAPTGNFNMQLLKSRHGGVGRLFNLRMSPLSLVVVDTLDKMPAMRVAQEVSLNNQGVHYDDFRKQVEAAAGQGVMNV